MATQKLYSLKNPVTGEFLPSMSEGAMLRIPAVFSSYWANKKKSVFPEYSEKVEVFPTHALADADGSIFLYFINSLVYRNTINHLNIQDDTIILDLRDENLFKIEAFGRDKIIETSLTVGDYLIAKIQDADDNSFYYSIFDSKTLCRDTRSYDKLSEAILHAVAKVNGLTDDKTIFNFVNASNYLLNGFKSENR